MLGNSFTIVNNMPDTLAQLTGAEVVHHTHGDVRLAEQLNPETKMGGLTHGVYGTCPKHPEIEHYAQETEELMCNTEQCNLEHIMNDSDSDVITSRVGNILLLSESINGNKGNASFSREKR